MSIQTELRRLAASLHFAEDRISVFRAANKLDDLEAEVERLKDTRDRQRICSECGGKIELFTADLDWCPTCKKTWPGI